MIVFRPMFVSKLLHQCGWARKSAPFDASLTPRALEIWQDRPDLKSTFDLKRLDGRTGMFWWYLFHGYQEMGLSPDEDGAALSVSINRSVPWHVQHGFTSITWLIREAYRRSAHSLGSLRSREGQQKVLAWFFARGMLDNWLGEFLTPHQAELLLASEAEAAVPLIAALIWQADPQLHRRFRGLEDPAFLAWCRGEGARDFPILSHPLIKMAPPWRSPVRVSGRLGVNLIGYAFGYSGLSEDIRAAARSLSAVGIPFAIHDIAGAASHGNLDQSIAAYAAQDLPFDINLFCVPGQTTVYAALKDAGLRRDRRHTIGMWPWELPEWPKFWQHAYSFVDEIWASSRFTYDAYCRSATVPVRYMPMAINVDATEGATRADFGLAADVFLFAFSFDGLSTFGRKNPEACLAAFQLAFPDRKSPVGLVMKGLRVQGSAAWDRLSRIMDADPRIVVITEPLPRGKLLDLYRCVDCFISLHRSEGFGRNIAEAMLLGKPVIVTAHSGNMDFTTIDTAALVPARLVSLAEGDYPYGRGQMWAEANVATAARLMRRILADREWRQAIAAAGAAHIERLYSPHLVGKRWLQALGGLSH